jgi:hypothetical protein
MNGRDMSKLDYASPGRRHPEPLRIAPGWVVVGLATAVVLLYVLSSVSNWQQNGL